jgi:hypothetical protein
MFYGAWARDTSANMAFIPIQFIFSPNSISVTDRFYFFILLLLADFTHNFETRYFHYLPIEYI